MQMVWNWILSLDVWYQLQEVKSSSTNTPPGRVSNWGSHFLMISWVTNHYSLVVRDTSMHTEWTRLPTQVYSHRIFDVSAHTHTHTLTHLRAQGWGGVPITFMFTIIAQAQAHTGTAPWSCTGGVGVGWGANSVHLHLHAQALHTDHVGLGLGWGANNVPVHPHTHTQAWGRQVALKISEVWNPKAE